MARPVQSRDRCMWRRVVDSEEDLISLTAEAAATIRQQLGTFVCTRHSLLHRCRLYIEVGGLRLNICSNLVRNVSFLQNTSMVLLDSQT